MATDGDMRRERIDRLLRELEYEITRGVMQQEIEPSFGFVRIMPGGPTGEVTMRLEVRPSHGDPFFREDSRPRLRVVGDKKEGQK